MIKYNIRNTPSNDRALCVYVPSGNKTKEQLAMGNFFEEQQNYLENESKIILGGFICTIDKTDRDDENKTQRLCRFGFN